MPKQKQQQQPTTAEAAATEATAEASEASEALIHGLAADVFEGLPPEVQASLAFSAAAREVGLDDDAIDERRAQQAEEAAASLKAVWPDAVQEALRELALSHFDITDIEALPFTSAECLLVTVGPGPTEGDVKGVQKIEVSPYTIPTLPEKKTRNRATASSPKAAEAPADVLRFVGACYGRPSIVGAKTVALSDDGQLVTRVGRDARSCFKNGDNEGRPIQAYHKATRVMYWVNENPAIYHARWQALCFWATAEKASGVDILSRSDAGLRTFNAGHKDESPIIDKVVPGFLSMFADDDIPESVTQKAVTLAELEKLAGQALPNLRPEIPSE